jgi:hypothetical protein
MQWYCNASFPTALQGVGEGRFLRICAKAALAEVKRGGRVCDRAIQIWKWCQVKLFGIPSLTPATELTHHEAHECMVLMSAAACRRRGAQTGMSVRVRSRRC